MYEHVYEYRIYMLHTYCHMQLNVLCNLSYATTQICSFMCHMQLNFSCKRQLQNPKFLVVRAWFLFCNFLCYTSVLVFYVLGLDSCIVTSELIFSITKGLANYFCATIRQKLF
jgi:hypothetical protein